MKDTVNKAEAAASRAAEERLKQGSKAESRIPADKEKHAKEELEKIEHQSKVASQLMSLDSGSVKEPNTKRVQEGSMFHVHHHFSSKGGRRSYLLRMCPVGKWVARTMGVEYHRTLVS